LQTALYIITYELWHDKGEETGENWRKKQWKRQGKIKTIKSLKKTKEKLMKKQTKAKL
jgi:hypothetical protein